MKMTISQIRQKIDSLEKEFKQRVYSISSYTTITKIKELSGEEETLTPEFDFHAELEEINKLSSQLAKLKGILTNANSVTQIDGVDTIQSAISKLQIKRQVLNKIEHILNNTKEFKRRKTDGNNSPAYIEIVSFNFDKQKLEAHYKKIQDEVDTLDSKVTRANETEVEVE